MKGITAIGHVAIWVRDVERTLDFYVNKLDFPEMMRLHHPDGSLFLIYLRITDEQYLEIFPDAAEERAPPREANGINHLCLEVDNIDLVIDELGKRGVPLAREKKLGLDRNLQAWIEDPDGNRIELMQMAADSMQSEAIARLRAG